MERYWKENHTLPVCSSKIKVFKEGQIRWNDMKPSFLNKSSKYHSCINLLIIDRAGLDIGIHTITNVKTSKPFEKNLERISCNSKYVCGK